MALLIVNALGNERIADPGDRDESSILLSVTDATGQPVIGLQPADVRVDAMIVAAGGALVNVVRLWPGSLPGFYRVDLVPTGAFTWRAGEYDIAVAVTQGANKGQALASFRVT
ncbi:MAG TPA: hypothetical protein VFT45_03385 [Longimicrobium sp.]|nr:hypothetical protein [Longimicrobium sp.]